MVLENRFSRLDRFEKRLERRKLIKKVPVKRLKDHSNPLEVYDSAQFKLRFHMYKETAIFIVNLIIKDISAPIRRGIHVPVILQFLTVLRFFCTGSFQIVIGDLENFSQGTISKMVKRVSIAIANLRKEYIKYPNHQQAADVKSKFFELGHFPGVVGCIDCSHIQINSPGGNDAELFRNRKGDFTINVQGICCPDLNFTNIVARWYGSAHDSRIFEDCKIYADLENGNLPGLLLGDSGYGCSIYLMPPIPNPTTRPEKRYQKAQLTTRNTIERTFGVWKMKFPCLRYLRTKLETSLVIIVATAVLHNITRKRGDLFLDDKYEKEPEKPNVNPNDVQNSIIHTGNGRALRQTIIQNHFT